MTPQTKLCLLAVLSTATLFAQTDVAQSVRAYRAANEHRILQELVDLLSIPNVAADIGNIRRNAAHLRQIMGTRGITTRLLEHERADVPPAVYGELNTPGAT